MYLVAEHLFLVNYLVDGYMNRVVQRGKKRPLNQVDLEQRQIQKLRHLPINAFLVGLIQTFEGKAQSKNDDSKRIKTKVRTTSKIKPDATSAVGVSEGRRVQSQMNFLLTSTLCLNECKLRVLKAVQLR